MWDLLAARFEKTYQQLKEYKEQYGNLLVPGKFVSPKGIELGKIVRNLGVSRHSKKQWGFLPFLIERTMGDAPPDGGGG